MPVPARRHTGGLVLRLVFRSSGAGSQQEKKQPRYIK
jgi:hypothetical protein